MFKDRKDAGEKLAKALEKYKSREPSYSCYSAWGSGGPGPVAKKLNADFSLIIARKLPFPDNPEAGFGAMTENGSTFIHENAYYSLCQSRLAGYPERPFS